MEDSTLREILDDNLVGVMKKYPRSQALRFFPTNLKLATVTHADTSRHTVDIESFTGSNVVAIVIYAVRTVGGDALLLFSNEGTHPVWSVDGSVSHYIGIKRGTHRLEYALKVANETFEIYMQGYFLGW